MPVGPREKRPIRFFLDPDDQREGRYLYLRRRNEHERLR